MTQGQAEVESAKPQSCGKNEVSPRRLLLLRKEALLEEKLASRLREPGFQKSSGARDFQVRDSGNHLCAQRQEFFFGSFIKFCLQAKHCVLNILCYLISSHTKAVIPSFQFKKLK